MPGKFGSVSADLRRHAAKRQRSIAFNGEAMKEAMKGHAQNLTSGPPGPAHGLPIGRRTGRLYSSLRVIPMGPGRWRLQYTAPHAPHVLNPRNTAKDRGFWREMDRRARRELRRIVRRESSFP